MDKAGRAQAAQEKAGMMQNEAEAEAAPAADAETNRKA